MYWEKSTEELKQTGEVIGVDVGINKLMTLSDGTLVGKEIKLLIAKLNRRKQKSKGWYRTIEEIKSYIKLGQLFPQGDYLIYLSPEPDKTAL